MNDRPRLAIANLSRLINDKGSSASIVGTLSVAELVKEVNRLRKELGRARTKVDNESPSVRLPMQNGLPNKRIANFPFWEYAKVN